MEMKKNAEEALDETAKYLFIYLYQERIKGKERASPIHTLFHR